MELDKATCYAALKARDSHFDGRFFTAVHTTGIYCRPVCPATPPKPENVTFYPSAAAAQSAGFRPCLRCRPELSPAVPAFHGTQATVARALQLIEDGALNTGSIEDLATRLGIGSRHLRRLFLTHLGATPVEVAQTRRTLLAKRLLTETHLSMADVAMAAGFGSIRRFNDVMQALYNRPPTALRRTLKPSNPMPPPEKLPFAPPYNWPRIREYLETRTK